MVTTGWDRTVAALGGEDEAARQQAVADLAAVKQGSRARIIEDYLKRKNCCHVSRANLAALAAGLECAQAVPILATALSEEVCVDVQRAEVASLAVLWVRHTECFDTSFAMARTRLSELARQSLAANMASAGAGQFPSEFQEAVGRLVRVTTGRAAKSVRKPPTSTLPAGVKDLGEGGRTFEGISFYVDRSGCIHIVDMSSVSPQGR